MKNRILRFHSRHKFGKGLLWHLILIFREWEGQASVVLPLEIRRELRIFYNLNLRIVWGLVEEGNINFLNLIEGPTIQIN